MASPNDDLERERLMRLQGKYCSNNVINHNTSSDVISYLFGSHSVMRRRKTFSDAIGEQATILIITMICYHLLTSCIFLKEQTAAMLSMALQIRMVTA
jgi:hypothetical protein